MQFIKNLMRRRIERKSHEIINAKSCKKIMNVYSMSMLGEKSELSRIYIQALA